MKTVRMFSTVTVLAAALAAVSTSAAEMRTWTDPTGSFSTQAEFVEMSSGGARLRRADGVLILVPLDRLSLIDRAYIQQTRSGGPTVTYAPAPRGDELDLSYVTADNCVALVVHPGGLTKLGFAKMIGFEDEIRPAMEAVGVGSEDIDEVLLLGNAPPKGNTEQELSVIVIRFAKPVDAKKFATALEGSAPLEQTVQGKTIYKNPDPSMADDLVTFQGNANTVVLAIEDALPEILSEEPVDSALTRRLAEVDTDADVVQVVIFDPLRDFFDRTFQDLKTQAAAGKLPPALVGMMETYDLAESLVVRVDLSGDKLLEVILQSADADDAAKVHGHLSVALAFAKEFVVDARDDIESFFFSPLTGRLVTELAGKLLATTAITQDGDQVVLVVKRLYKQDRVIELIVPRLIKAGEEQ